MFSMRMNMRKIASAACAALIMAGAFPITTAATPKAETIPNDSMIRIDNETSGELVVPPVQINEVTIADIDRTTLDVGKVAQNVHSAVKTELTNKSGNIKTKGQTDTYEFKVKRDGIHRFEMSGLGDNEYEKSVKLEVILPDGSSETKKGADGTGFTAEFKKGDKVTVKVSQHLGFGTYKLSIGNPNPVTDLSGYTKISSELRFKEQVDIYKYTASENGQHRFEVDDIEKGKLWVEVTDQKGEELGINRGSDGTGVTLDLKSGNTCYIKVYAEYANNISGSYTLNLDSPRKTTDISGYGNVKDSVEYSGQVNCYSYTPQESGVYVMAFPSLKGVTNTGLNLSVYSPEGELMGDKLCYKEYGLRLKFTKGKTYTIKVAEDLVKTEYTLTIVRETNNVDVSAYNRINDCIVLADQKNTYTYVPEVDGDYFVKVSGLSEANNSKVDIKFYFPDGSVRTDTYKALTLKKGQKYKIEIGFCLKATEYTLDIVTPRPVQDISGKRYVKDSVSDPSQTNRYIFVPSKNGLHRFQLEDLQSGNDVVIRILDPNGKKLQALSIDENGAYSEVDLIKGETYTIEMSSHWHTTATYTLVISDSVGDDITPSPTPANSNPEPTKKPVPNNDTTRQIRSFVDRIYTYVLDREPETAGADFWTAELYNFDRSGAEVAQGFIFSEEFTNRNTSDEQFVTVLYKTFFGREPEADGMNYWLGQMASGAMSRVDVANGFIFSQEWADTCASYGIRSGGTTAATVNIEPSRLTRRFVERLYVTAMQRDYDESGLNYWAGELANFRMSGETAGAAFFLSDEMAGFNLSDEDFLSRLYETFMDRIPDNAGSAYWLEKMSAGTTRAEVVFGFTRSPEFTQKCIDARILPY